MGFSCSGVLPADLTGGAGLFLARDVHLSVQRLFPGATELLALTCLAPRGLEKHDKKNNNKKK